MVVVEPMPVHPAAMLTRENFRPGEDSMIPHFRKVAAAIQQNGAVAVQQASRTGIVTAKRFRCA